jgi:nucleoprotein TPR
VYSTLGNVLIISAIHPSKLSHSPTMASAAVDISYIAASYSIPEPTLQTLLDSPTSELIQDLLQKIEEKAREHESIQAEKLRSDVELETAVQNGNRRAKQLKNSVDKGLKEIEELRRELSSEGRSQ